MRKLLTIVFCSIALASAALAQPIMRADQVFMVDARRSPDGSVEFTWTIQPGNYLYRDRIRVMADNGSELPINLPDGERKDDPNFGEVEIYHQGPNGYLSANSLPTSGIIKVAFQGCAEIGVCYPAVEKQFDLRSSSLAGAPSVIPFEAPKDILTAAAEPEGDSGFRIIFGSSYGLLLVSFLGFGVLLSLTPCVFPMIPILGGILVRSGERLSVVRAALLSGAYALSIGMAYGAVGAASAWFGQGIQSAMQAPIVQGAFALIYFALALSMFGLFDLQVPSFLAERISGSSARGGTIRGSLALGFGSALVVGPCVTPPLAAAILYVSQTGDVLRGTSALFALGFGMGLPLILFGMFGAAMLPKSGSWMIWVKHVFGGVFILLAIGMLSRMMAPNTSLLLWSGTAVALGAWLLAPPSSGEPISVVSRAAGTLATLYGALLLIGFAAGGKDPVQPLDFLLRIDSSSAPEIIGQAALDQAIKDASTGGKPVLLDFTADWCSACKDFERNVLSDPEVRHRLRSFRLVKIDMTTASHDIEEMLKRYDVVGPPSFIVLNPRTGLEAGRSVGEVTAGAFMKLLDYQGS